MNEIPDDVYCGSVNLLDAVNAVRGYYETVVGNLRKTPAILSREGDGQQLLLARSLQRVKQIWRFPTRAKGHRHIPGRGEEPKLIDKHAREIEIVADRGHGRNVRHQRDHRKRLSFFDDGMVELDGDVKRVAQTAAISHGEQLAASLEALSHLARHGLKRLRVLDEEFLLHLHAFAALADHLVTEGLVHPVLWGPQRRRHNRCPNQRSRLRRGSGTFGRRRKFVRRHRGGRRMRSRRRKLLQRKPSSRRGDAVACIPFQRRGSRAAF